MGACSCVRRANGAGEIQKSLLPSLQRKLESLSLRCIHVRGERAARVGPTSSGGGSHVRTPPASPQAGGMSLLRSAPSPACGGRLGWGRVPAFVGPTEPGKFRNPFSRHCSGSWNPSLCDASTFAGSGPRALAPTPALLRKRGREPCPHATSLLANRRSELAALGPFPRLRGEGAMSLRCQFPERVDACSAPSPACGGRSGWGPGSSVRCDDDAEVATAGSPRSLP